MAKTAKCIFLSEAMGQGFGRYLLRELEQTILEEEPAYFEAS